MGLVGRKRHHNFCRLFGQGAQMNHYVLLISNECTAGNRSVEHLLLAFVLVSALGPRRLPLLCMSDFSKNQLLTVRFVLQLKGPSVFCLCQVESGVVKVAWRPR